MKIAIASEKNNIESMVCNTAGRAPYYLIFENKQLVKSIKNPFVFGSGGAGLAVTQMISNEGVEFVISGKFGPKMIEALNDKQIKFKEVENIMVKEILEEISND